MLQRPPANTVVVAVEPSPPHASGASNTTTPADEGLARKRSRAPEGARERGHPVTPITRNHEEESTRGSRVLLWPHTPLTPPLRLFVVISWFTGQEADHLGGGGEQRCVLSSSTLAPTERSCLTSEPEGWEACRYKPQVTLEGEAALATPTPVTSPPVLERCILGNIVLGPRRRVRY